MDITDPKEESIDSLSNHVGRMPQWRFQNSHHLFVRNGEPGTSTRSRETGDAEGRTSRQGSLGTCTPT